MVVLAAGTLGMLAVLIFSTSPLSAIPWVAQPVMWGVLVAVLAQIIELALLPKFFTPLRACLDRVAKSRGLLEPGEKASDPWLLRLKPLEEPRYSRPVEDSMTMLHEDVINHRFLRCSTLSVGKWEIGAVATIVGPPGIRVEFKWTLDGKPLGSGSVTPDGRQSTMSLPTPTSTKGTGVLLVEARDKAGLVKTKEATVDLQSTYTTCRAWVALIQPELESPIMPWTVERLQPAFDAFHRTADEIARGGFEQDEIERPGV
jgi:hypothetical protein